MAERLLCAVCIFTSTEAQPAVTVMGGTAVCYDHLGYAQDSAVTFSIQQLGQPTFPPGGESRG